MKFSGVTILQGVEFSIFPIDFEWALQQCSATALPVMKQHLMSLLAVQLTPAYGARLLLVHTALDCSVALAAR